MKLQAVFAIAAIFVMSHAAAQQAKPKPDWITTTNQPCKLWNPEPQPDESVTWPLIDDVLTCATAQAASNKMAMNVLLMFLMS